MSFAKLVFGWMSYLQWLLLLFLFQSSAYANEPEKSSIKDKFPVPQASFQKYLQDSLIYLKQNNQLHRSSEEIALNMPFELASDSKVDYRGKFLLLHGLNDSPFVWRDVAVQLSRRGFDVRAILLPGHGTTPKHLLDVHYNDWLSTVRRHYILWNNDETPFYLGGFSLGGVIATMLSLENDDVSGMLLFSPAYHSKLNHMLRWSGIYSKFKPWVFGGMIIEDNPAKYNSIPINSASQYYKTTKILKRKWKSNKIAIPSLMIVTENDSVVDISYVRKTFRTRFNNPKSRLIVYSSNPKFDVKDREIRRNSSYPKKRILNQSHLSMMNAPHNTLYGSGNNIRNGEGLLVCNGNEWPIFSACLRSKQHWYGAQHTPSPDGVAVARTTINPDFAFIFEEFDRVFPKK